MDIAERLAIHELIGLYGHILDDCAQDGGSWDQLDQIFTDDAIFDLTGMGYKRIEGLAALKDEMSRGVHPRSHHMTNIVVTPDGDGARARTKLLATLGDGRACTGDYRDRLVRTSHGWRIQQRTPNIRVIDPDAPLPYFSTRQPNSGN